MVNCLGKINISIAAPAYNEAECIKEVVNGWQRFLASSPVVNDFEIVVCDDGSRDDTGEILVKMAEMDHHVRLVRHETNQGAAAALATAITATTKDWILLLDSDGQFQVEDLTVLLNALPKNGQAVMGARSLKEDSPGARFGAWGSTVACNLIYGTHYNDFSSAFKLIKGDLARSLCFEAKGLNYSVDITGKLLEKGVNIVEVPVRHEKRRAGKSSMRFLHDALHRLAFISYLGARKFMISHNIIKRP